MLIYIFVNVLVNEGHHLPLGERYRLGSDMSLDIYLLLLLTAVIS